MKGKANEEKQKETNSYNPKHASSKRILTFKLKKVMLLLQLKLETYQWRSQPKSWEGE